MKKPGGPKWATPELYYPTVKIPQADGSVIFAPRKPVVVAEDMVSTREAARIIGMSRRWVQTECDFGHFKTARKLGLGPCAWWKIARSEVLARKGMKPD